MSGPVYKVGDPAPPPLPRRSEAEVMARWQGDKPVVSILCPTYQHVDFIEDALRGFLGQDTDFPFEILVRDDASTDGTAEIVRDYAERYPNIIRAVLETENRYPEVKARQVLGPMVRGEFIAVCEGDDYWFSPDKLHLQHSLLSKYPGLAATHHDSLIIEDGFVVSEQERPRSAKNLSALALRTWAMIPVRNIMFRAGIEVLTLRGHSGDKLLSRSVGLAGGAAFLSGGAFSAYRKHLMSWSNTHEKQQDWKFGHHYRCRTLAMEMMTRRKPVSAAYWLAKSVPVFPIVPRGRSTSAH